MRLAAGAVVVLGALSGGGLVHCGSSDAVANGGDAGASGGPDGGGSAAGDAGEGGAEAGAGRDCFEPLIMSGQDTGFDRSCDGSAKRRRFATTCPMPTKIDPCAGGVGTSSPTSDVCKEDSDCKKGVNGRCSQYFDSCECIYNCSSDADCAADELCVCDDEGNRCVKADCRSNADCHDSTCVSYHSLDCNDGDGFACVHDLVDTCVVQSDCDPNYPPETICVRDAKTEVRVCASSLTPCTISYGPADAGPDAGGDGGADAGYDSGADAAADGG